MSPATQKIAVLRLERRELSTIKPHPKNPRSHPEVDSERWRVLQASLEHDYFDPIVVNDRNGMLVSGHLRCRVLQHAGFTHADVSVVDYDEPTHLARLVAANKLLGDFADGGLEALAAEILAAGLPAALAGWDEGEFAGQLGGPVLPADDSENAEALLSAAEELQKKWVVTAGDIWTIGRHRLTCASSTEIAAVAPLFADVRADMVWTDPPYNVDYADLLNDCLPPEEFEKMLREAFQVARHFTKAGGAIYVAHADSLGLANRRAMSEAGWKISQCLVWVKNKFTLGRQDYQWQHEPILYGWAAGAGHYWQGGFSQGTVIDEEESGLNKKSKQELVAIIQRLRNARETTIVRESSPHDSPLHPTVKPLPLVARQIWNSTPPGALVFEPFAGSGTTMVAAEQMGRSCYAVELDPKYCAVVLERMAGLGLKPERSSHGTAVA